MNKNFNILNLLISECQIYYSYESFPFIYFNIFLIKIINLIMKPMYFESQIDTKEDPNTSTP